MAVCAINYTVTVVVRITAVIDLIARYLFRTAIFAFLRALDAYPCWGGVPVGILP